MADTAIAERDPLAGLSSALQLFTGKTTTQTEGPSTQTTTSNLTSDQLNAIIQEAMAPAGLASHAAGMYGDTSLAMARAQIAAQTAGKFAGQTVQNTGKTLTTKAQPQLGSASGGILGTILAASMGNKAIKNLSGVDLADKAMKGLKSAMTPSPEAGIGGASGSDASLFYDAGAGEAPLGASVASAAGTDALAAGMGGATGAEMSLFSDLGAGSDLLDTGLAASLATGGADLAAGIGGASGADAALFYDAGTAATDAAGLDIFGSAAVDTAATAAEGAGWIDTALAVLGFL